MALIKGKRADPLLISIVVTVRNEARRLPSLLESLLPQEPPFEVLLVDAFSDDGTWGLCQAFASAHPDIARAFQRGGTRGAGRNFGVAEARGEAVAFIDGDCIASARWLSALREGVASAPAVAGRTSLVGLRAFCALPDLPALPSGARVGYPACNLLYRRPVFEALGGFDPRLRTFEDVDLNMRALAAGYSIAERADALVFGSAADSLFDFLVQSFWTGYGRRQAWAKHPDLARSARRAPFVPQSLTFTRLVRRAFVSMGESAASRDRPRALAAAVPTENA